MTEAEILAHKEHLFRAVWLSMKLQDALDASTVPEEIRKQINAEVADYNLRFGSVPVEWPHEVFTDASKNPFA
jgi:hypothetical protein